MALATHSRFVWPDLFGVFYGLIVVGWQCDVALVTGTKLRIATHEI